MNRALVLSCVLGISVVACEQKSKPEPPTASTQAAAPTEPAPPNDKAGTPTTEAVAQKTAEDTQDIPTSSDFEDQAEQSITPANLESELAALEKEIGPADHAKPANKMKAP